jgi:hypothetical protein
VRVRHDSDLARTVVVCDGFEPNTGISRFPIADDGHLAGPRDGMAECGQPQAKAKGILGHEGLHLAQVLVGYLEMAGFVGKPS